MCPPLNTNFSRQANLIFPAKNFPSRNETLLARGLGDKIPPCFKRCSTPNRRVKPLTARDTDARRVSLHVAGAAAGRQIRRALPRRKNPRRRFSRTRPGGLERGRRRLAQEKRRFRAAHPRRRRAAGFWRNGSGRRAHLSRLAARPDARARRQCPSRQAAGRLCCR